MCEWNGSHEETLCAALTVKSNCVEEFQLFFALLNVDKSRRCTCIISELCNLNACTGGCESIVSPNQCHCLFSVISNFFVKFYSPPTFFLEVMPFKI